MKIDIFSKENDIPRGKYKKIDGRRITSFLRCHSDESITIDAIKRLIPEGTIHDYDNLLHEAVSDNIDKNKVYQFVKVLCNDGHYNPNHKSNPDGYNFIQAALCYSQYPVETIVSFCQPWHLDVNTKDINGNSIIHTAIESKLYCDKIFPILEALGENFNLECKNNEGMNIFDTFDVTKNNVKKEKDSVQEYYLASSLNEKYKSLCQENFKENVEIMVRCRKRKLQVEKNGLSDEEKLNQKMILIRLESIDLSTERKKIEFYDYIRSTIDEIGVLQDENTNEPIFDYYQIEKLKECLQFSNPFSDYSKAEWAGNMAVVITGRLKNIQEKQKRKEKELARIKEKIKNDELFMNIIKNKDKILSLKNDLKKINYQISKQLDSSVEEEFISTEWDIIYEKQLKEIVKIGIDQITVPIDNDTLNNIVNALEAYGFLEEIERIKKLQRESLGNIIEQELTLSNAEEILDQVSKTGGNDKEELLNKVKEYKNKMASIVKELQSITSTKGNLLSDIEESDYLTKTLSELSDILEIEKKQVEKKIPTKKTVSKKAVNSTASRKRKNNVNKELMSENAGLFDSDESSSIKDSEVQEPPKQKVKQKRTK